MYNPKFHVSRKSSLSSSILINALARAARTRSLVDSLMKSHRPTAHYPLLLGRMGGLVHSDLNTVYPITITPGLVMHWDRRNTLGGIVARSPFSQSTTSVTCAVGTSSGRSVEPRSITQKASKSFVDAALLHCGQPTRRFSASPEPLFALATSWLAWKLANVTGPEQQRHSPMNNRPHALTQHPIRDF